MEIFPNSKTRILVWEKLFCLYTNNIQLNWTPIQPIINNRRIDKIQSHIIRKIQFPIQLVITITIYWSKGFSLDGLTFDPTNVKEHGLSCIIFFHIQTKERLYLLISLQHHSFHINQSIAEKMKKLKVYANWTHFVPWLK